MKNFVGIFIIILAVIGIFLFNNNDAGNTLSEYGTKERSGKFDKAPDFTLKNYEGEEVSLSQFTGKPKIINSWAMWCPFCVEELPDFTELKKEFGDDIVVIAIDRKESLKQAKEFTDSLGVTNNLVFLLDPEDSFYKSIGGFSMPETIFVDGDNNIIIHKRGFMTFDEMRDKTKQLLEIN